MNKNISNHYQGEAPICCPKCKCVRRKVYCTEHMSESIVKRYCVCSECGRKYTTMQG